MDVSSDISLSGLVSFTSLHTFEREGRKEGICWCHNWSRDRRGSLLGLRVIGSKLIKVVSDPGRTVQLKRPGAGLTYCFLHTQACSTEERKRDFEKIFAHYDVVSVSFWVVLTTWREQACLAPCGVILPTDPSLTRWIASPHGRRHVPPSASPCELLKLHENGQRSVHGWEENKIMFVPPLALNWEKVSPSWSPSRKVCSKTKANNQVKDLHQPKEIEAKRAPVDIKTTSQWDWLCGPASERRR